MGYSGRFLYFAHFLVLAAGRLYLTQYIPYLLRNVSFGNTLLHWHAGTCARKYGKLGVTPSPLPGQT